MLFDYSEFSQPHLGFWGKEMDMTKAYVLMGYSEVVPYGPISAVTTNPLVAANWEKDIKNFEACERILRGSVWVSFRNLNRDHRKNGERFHNHTELCPDNSFEKSVWCKPIAYERTIGKKLLKYARARVAIPPVGSIVKVYETE